MNFSQTCLWTELVQKRIGALLYGSSGRNRRTFFQVSSMKTIIVPQIITLIFCLKCDVAKCE